MLGLPGKHVGSGDAVARLCLFMEIDLAAEKARLAKEVARLEGEISKAHGKLGNAAFVAKVRPMMAEESKNAVIGKLLAEIAAVK